MPGETYRDPLHFGEQTNTRRLPVIATLCVRWIARALVGVALVHPAPGAAQATPDYAREARWADEVVPQIVVGDAVWLATPSRARVLAIHTEPAGKAKGGVIVVHGLGVHPDFGVAGALRSALVERGFATLSVQMPVLAADAPREQYRAVLPLAQERIGAAVHWLRARGFAMVAIVSHSMGATMTDAYLARRDAARIEAWAPLGMPVAFGAPPRQPVLDVIAQDELAEVVAAAPLRRSALPGDGCSAQVTIRAADHYFGRQQQELTAVIAAFLDRVSEGRCG